MAWARGAWARMRVGAVGMRVLRAALGIGAAAAVAGPLGFGLALAVVLFPLLGEEPSGWPRPRGDEPGDRAGRLASRRFDAGGSIVSIESARRARATARAARSSGEKAG